MQPTISESNNKSLIKKQAGISSGLFSEQDLDHDAISHVDQTDRTSFLQNQTERNFQTMFGFEKAVHEKSEAISSTNGDKQRHNTKNAAARTYEKMLE